MTTARPSIRNGPRRRWPAAAERLLSPIDRNPGPATRRAARRARRRGGDRHRHHRHDRLSVRPLHALRRTPAGALEGQGLSSHNVKFIYCFQGDKRNIKTPIGLWQPYGNHAARFRDLYLPPFVGPRSVLALRRISGRIWVAPSAFDARIQMEAHRGFGFNHESIYFSTRKVRATRATLLSPPQISKEI